jgi:hypothetical protein
MNMSNYTENKLIDFILRGFAFSQPATIAIALTTVVPDDTSTGATIVEPVGGGYTRMVVGPGPANWFSTNGAIVGPSTGTNGTTGNVDPVVFPKATANWGTIVGACICDDSTTGSGNVLFWGSLVDPKVINIDDIFLFDTSNISLQIDD